MPAPPPNDSIARVLREHFDTEASDAGLRSPDWKSAGIRIASTPDAAMTARRILRQDEHRRVREALAKISPEHREALELAYGVTFRARDVDDGSGRRALRTEERNWRVRLREIYDFPECAIVLCALVSARALIWRSFGSRDAYRTWLLTVEGKNRSNAIEKDALEVLQEACGAFAAVYEPPVNQPRLDAEPPRKIRKIDREAQRERRRREAEDEERSVR